MQLILGLFFSFVMIAFIFVFFSLKTSNSIFKLSGLIHSIIFFTASAVLLGIYFKDHKEELVYAKSHMLTTNKTKEMQKQKLSTFSIQEPNLPSKQIRLNAPL